MTWTPALEQAADFAQPGLATAPASLLLAVPVAVAAAASYGLAGTLQHWATQRVRKRQVLQAGLLADLVRQPLWMLSIVATLAGFGLQALALRFGPLILVQPLLVTGLLFASLFTAWLNRQRPDRLLVFGATICVVGLAGFLTAGRPTPGSGELTLADALPLSVALAVVLAVCSIVAARGRGATRALPLALAAGACYGLTAGLIKLVTVEMGQGWAIPLYHWALYALIVLGPLGFLFSQNAFQAGVHPAPPLAVITVADPLVGIGIGLLWLNETIATSAWAIALEVVALALLTAGVAAVSRRAPQVAPG